MIARSESSSSIHITLLILSYQICFLYKSIEVYVPIPPPGSFVRDLDLVKEIYLEM